MRVVSRSQWGARPPRKVVAIPWSRVRDTFVHYTAGPESQTPRQIQAYHMGTQGWSDVAYSWLVDQAGTIYEGRGWGVAGGHTQSHNSTSHAICWIGSTGQPSDAALASIRWLCDEADRLAARPIPRRPHRAVNATSCPGDLLAAWVDAGMPTTPEEVEPMALHRLIRAEGDARVYVTDWIHRRHVPSEAHLADLLYLDAEQRFLGDRLVRVVSRDVVESIPLVDAPVEVEGISDEAAARIAAETAAEFQRRLAS